ncbi:O-acetyl-ADP-ribose deacetylase (regulator of RNase III) [Kribbella antiqua]|uniref:O-acetyl-ADP-ribose deacetylase (Regulator of RNase III) n=1 Tax=Kribbella antiqua TaxID=2512217 RepID=A0A4R2II48_9ACTN|nr:macro domain-containing protein [Kribbella antiqua]TCO44167.1 O-acetyl-ADP-ribose deacetylase (regulator of RNase III) [Kribbella antiqua]
MDIVLSTADITTVPADAIVNAAHHALRGGGGVDGAIHRAGGREILDELIERYPNGAPTGTAVWTTAGALPASYVIHVVGPNYTVGQRDPALLESCYRNALRIADELGVKTLALPAVSAGIYGWPAQSAADIAVQALRGTATDVTTATFCLVDPRLYKAFQKATAAGE